MSYLCLYIIITTIIIIIIIVCQFRLISPRSYIVTLIPMLNKFLKQTNKQSQNLICAWKTYVVRGSGLTFDKIIITKIWKFARTVNVMFLRKFERPISGFQSEVFSLLFFSLCSFCVHYFSFSLLFIIRPGTKWQRTRINKASNINKIITMPSWRNEDKRPYWIFRKIIYFGVI